MKKVVFCGASHRRIKEFPEEAKDSAGHQLWLVQLGRDPLDWRPMVGIAPGVKEIRIHEPHEHRVIYVANFPEAIYVLHAFEKKTRTTPKRDVDIARAAYAEIHAKRR
jgi:phage-related protein